MSDTPRTDAMEHQRTETSGVGDLVVRSEAVRIMERELTAALARVEELERREKDASRLLARWYFASRRQGWESGEKEEDVVDAVVCHLANTLSAEWPCGWNLERTLRALDGEVKS